MKSFIKGIIAGILLYLGTAWYLEREGMTWQEGFVMAKDKVVAFIEGNKHLVFEQRCTPGSAVSSEPDYRPEYNTELVRQNAAQDEAAEANAGPQKEKDLEAIQRMISSLQ